MLCRSVAVVAAAALAAVAWVSPIRADDVVRLGLDTSVRLGLNGSAPTITLGGDKDADTTDVAWRRYGYSGYYAPRYYGGYSGYYGGYGGYGGYSYYPRYSYGYSSYYPRYSYGYGSYYPRYYGYSSYYYTPRYYGYGNYYSPRSYYYYPIGMEGNCPSDVVTVPGRPGVMEPVNPNAPPAAKDGTFPYDGGPDRPVPMPKVGPEKGTNLPRESVPIEGRPVLLPAKPKYVYPAYGEQPAKSQPTQPGSIPVKATR